MDLQGAAQMKRSQGTRSDDRRCHPRYATVVKLRWKLIRADGALDSGTGTTVDLSSGGVLFETDRELRVGGRVELSLAWPVLLRDVAPLQLRIVGDVVRNVGRRVAVRIRQHELRSVGLAR